MSPVRASTSTEPGILVIGFGNPGRADDGLGPALAEALLERDLAGVDVRIDYQLAVEHAADVAAARVVIFVDATVDPGCRPFALERLHPEPGLDFTSHALAPARVLALAGELFGASPTAWLLTIGGECFDPFREGLSATGRANLEGALEFVLGMLPAGRRGR